MTQITKSTMIGELLQIDQNIAPILLNIGMHCLGCPSSQMETVEEAAMVHGIDPTGTGIPFFLLLNAARPLKLCQRLKRMIFQNHLIVLFHERACCRRIRLLRSIFG